MKSEISSGEEAQELTEADIRDYAYHLYEQRGCEPGHDLDDWLEARACLLSNIPKHRSHARLHAHWMADPPMLALPVSRVNQ